MNSKMVDYFGQKKTLYETFCGTCGKAVWLRKHLLDRKRYCSNECRAISRQKWLELECALCKASFMRRTTKVKVCKSGLRFCSKSCKAKAQRIEGGLIEVIPKNYKGGRRNYRERAIREYGATCKSCSYDEHEAMLDVDHIDENRQNNKIENLQVLCVWCHALKTRRVKISITQDS